MNWRDYRFKGRDRIPADWANWVTKMISNLQPGSPGLRIDYGADAIVLSPTGPGDGTDDQGVIPFLGYPYNDSGTVKLKVNGGTIYAPESVTTIPAVTYSLGTERWVYLEFTVEDGTDPYTVTGTIQSVTGATPPTFYAYATGTATIKWLIGHLTSANRWDQLWDGGDVYLPVPLDALLKGIQGYDAAETQILMHVSGTVQWKTVDECP